MLIGCGEDIDPNEPQGFIQTKGSDTIVNAMQQVAENFMLAYPHVFVAVTGGGSGVGIASLINKTCDVATASREMKPKEIEIAHKRKVYPKEFVVAYDGVAVIVNKSNPVDRLTIEDLHKIFTAEAVNWKQFGGKDLPIVTLSREVSSGTYTYFKEEVVQLGKKDSTEEFSAETLLLTSSQAIVEEVAGNESAIGYLGMGYLSDRTKPVLVGKAGEPPHLPDVENVIKKAYPLSRPLSVQLGTYGKHTAENALAAAAVGLHFGIGSRKIKSVLEKHRPSTKRMEVLRIQGVTILNDTYNANPDSVRSALQTLAAMECRGRRIVVLGDMLELGDSSKREHKGIGNEIGRLGFEYVLTYGKESEMVCAESHVTHAFHYEEKPALAAYLEELVKLGDVVLVKGSRGMRMEDVVIHLIEYLRAKT